MGRRNGKSWREDVTWSRDRKTWRSWRVTTIKKAFRLLTERPVIQQSNVRMWSYFRHHWCLREEIHEWQELWMTNDEEIPEWTGMTDDEFKNCIRVSVIRLFVIINSRLFLFRNIDVRIVNRWRKTWRVTWRMWVRDLRLMLEIWWTGEWKTVAK